MVQQECLDTSIRDWWVARQTCTILHGDLTISMQVVDRALNQHSLGMSLSREGITICAMLINMPQDQGIHVLEHVESGSVACMPVNIS